MYRRELLIHVHLISHLSKILVIRCLAVQCLALVPTRELAQQVAQVVSLFDDSCKVRHACIYGGAPKGPQIAELDRGMMKKLCIFQPYCTEELIKCWTLFLSVVTYKLSSCTLI